MEEKVRKELAAASGWFVGSVAELFLGISASGGAGIVAEYGCQTVLYKNVL